MWYDKLLHKGRNARLKEKLDVKATERSFKREAGGTFVGETVIATAGTYTPVSTEVSYEDYISFKTLPPCPVYGYHYTVSDSSGVIWTKAGHIEYTPTPIMPSWYYRSTDCSLALEYYKKVNPDVEFQMIRDSFYGESSILQGHCVKCGQVERIETEVSITCIDQKVMDWLKVHLHVETPVEEEFCTKCFRIREEGKCECNG